MVLYLAGGNDGLNVIVPDDSGRLRCPTSRAAEHPPCDRTALKGPTDTPRRGSARTALPGPAARRSRSPNVTVSKTGGGDNSAPRFNFTGVGGDWLGFDTLFGNGTGGAGSDLAIMPAVDAKQYNLSHFDNSDIWFRASNDVNIKTGWLGRWLEHYGSDVNPLQAISIDTALSKSIRTSAKPVCAIPSLPMGGFRMNSTPYGGVNDGVTPSTPLRRQRACRQVGRQRPTTRTCRARARPTGSRSRPTSARSRRRHRPGRTRSTRTPARCPRGCGPPRTCWRPTSARASSRSTGARSTPTPASSSARTASSPSSRARSPPSRPT